MSALEKVGSRGTAQSGDAVNDELPVHVRRYGGLVRLNHWVTAVSLMLLAISGMALFTPKLFFLTALFGGGQMTRTMHPWIGLVLVVSFFPLFVRFWRANLPTIADGVWLKKIIDVVSNRDETLPELGKYNAGQKFVFWSMSALIMVLVSTGVVIWDQYFSGFVSIELQRFAVLIHASVAVFAICVWIIHVYAAFWVKGTFGAMTKGVVTGGWAWRHHRLWLKQLVEQREAKDVASALPASADPSIPHSRSQA